MIDMAFLYGAIAIMLVVILADLLKRKYNVDLDNLNLTNLKLGFYQV